MMDRFLTGAILIAAAALLVLLWRHLSRASAERIAQRAGYLDACRPLLERPRMGRGSSGFARLAGQYDGIEADIQTLPDTLTFRKLPALWVLVTLPGPLPVDATMNLMIRPTGVEPFSRFHTLTHQLDRPEGFPEDCAIRTDSRANVPPEDLVRAHLSIFDDPRVKELVISPKGVRIVFLAEEAQRSRYLIYRDAEMGTAPLAPELLRPKLDALIALRADIIAGARTDDAAAPLQEMRA
ncbi:hypothetical protein DC366_14505 [Pelagivirga sediminicola]|uniref:DUF3137 domain-containing protein n=1 Tax=Pelagivirga sediminicola TaxID=2170575 RepID=A0A2T7G4L2_9RHOB|nr:hypothetical protein [Pelagivirga sediminicola]PVA09330.1 hypothetical protein DC366_14505 [Pelagivirga sediminicola]